MPRQNRVTPFAELIAIVARGTLMGNRGCLHDTGGRIRRHHVGRRWIYCVLEFKGRRRRVMAPGRYTELFFLDEATALAAGHRPCAECQRERYVDFRRCWLAGQGRSGQAVSVDEVDAALHAERWGAGPRLERWQGLPHGVMVADGAQAYLVGGGGLRSWTPDGYGAPAHAPPSTLRLLTPPSVVAAIRQGYRVRPHPSAP